MEVECAEHLGKRVQDLSCGLITFNKVLLYFDWMIKGIIKWARFYFGFSKTEANGFIILSIILIAVTFLPWIVKNSIYREKVSDTHALDSLVALMDERFHYDNKEESNKPVFLQLFSFDPNTATLADFKKLGLRDEISNRIIKYRDKGGIFHEVNDMKKIYGLSNEKFENIKPFINLPGKARSIETNHVEVVVTSEKSVRIPAEINVVLHFDINKTDSLTLLQVQGIGTVLSSRIVRFRNNLGGFVHMEQLNEVYGIEDYAIANLRNAAFISDDFKPVLININQAPFEELAGHPYVSFNLASVIVAYREQHGLFKNIRDLLQIQIVEKQWLNRMEPYLEI